MKNIILITLIFTLFSCGEYELREPNENYSIRYIGNGVRKIVDKEKNVTCYLIYGSEINCIKNDNQKETN